MSSFPYPLIPLERLSQHTPTGTILNLADEIKFRNWVEQHQIHDLDHPQSHYDYRGFWQAQQSGDPNAVQGSNLHYPDTYKLPGHPSFSNESQYGSPDDPHWQEGTSRLVRKNGSLVMDEDGARRLR